MDIVGAARASGAKAYKLKIDAFRAANAEMVTKIEAEMDAIVAKFVHELSIGEHNNRLLDVDSGIYAGIAFDKTSPWVHVIIAYIEATHPFKLTYMDTGRETVWLTFASQQ